MEASEEGYKKYRDELTGLFAHYLHDLLKPTGFTPWTRRDAFEGGRVRLTRIIRTHTPYRGVKLKGSPDLGLTETIILDVSHAGWLPVVTLTLADKAEPITAHLNSPVKTMEEMKPKIAEAIEQLKRDLQ